MNSLSSVLDDSVDNTRKYIEEMQLKKGQRRKEKYGIDYEEGEKPHYSRTTTLASESISVVSTLLRFTGDSITMLGGVTEKVGSKSVGLIENGVRIFQDVFDDAANIISEKPGDSQRALKRSKKVPSKKKRTKEYSRDLKYKRGKDGKDSEEGGENEKDARNDPLTNHFSTRGDHHVCVNTHSDSCSTGDEEVVSNAPTQIKKILSKIVKTAQKNAVEFHEESFMPVGGVVEPATAEIWCFIAINFIVTVLFLRRFQRKWRKWGKSIQRENRVMLKSGNRQQGGSEGSIGRENGSASSPTMAYTSPPIIARVITEEEIQMETTSTSPAPEAPAIPPPRPPSLVILSLILIVVNIIFSYGITEITNNKNHEVWRAAEHSAFEDVFHRIHWADDDVDVDVDVDVDGGRGGGGGGGDKKSDRNENEASLWLNRLLNTLWRVPHDSKGFNLLFGGLEVYISDLIEEEIIEVLVDNLHHTNNIAHVELNSISLGPTPPVIRGLGMECDEPTVCRANLDLDLLLRNMMIELNVKFSSLEHAMLPTTKIVISNLDTRIDLDVEMGLIPDYPFIENLKFSLHKLPKVNVKIKPLDANAGLNVDLTSLPVLNSWIKMSINSCLEEYITPNFYEFDLVGYLDWR